MGCVSSSWIRTNLDFLPWLGLGQDGGGSTADIAASSENVKQYSWDLKRQEVDVTKFIFEDTLDSELVKLPGDINGEQFIIRNCQNCNIYIFDHCNTVSIDDCRNCNFFIGPTKGSLFLRDCEECSIVAACGQFRTRDCRGMTAFLCCDTQPTIEATQSIKFSCFQYFYPQLEAQFKRCVKCEQDRAGLSPYNNQWQNIHDFSQDSSEEKNYKMLGEFYKVSDFLPKCCTVDSVMDIDHHKSLVPLVTKNDTTEEVCLVVIFNEDHHGGKYNDYRSGLMVENMLADHKLVMSRKVSFEGMLASEFREEARSNYTTNCDKINIFIGKGVIERALASRDEVHLDSIKEVDDLRGTKNTIYTSASVEKGFSDAKLAMCHADMSTS